MATRIRTASDEAIREAAALLQQGELVAFPTETVYGLGADATRDSAAAQIFEAKQRPSFNPLIAHFVSLEDARTQVEFDTRAEAVANAFWPGPLTLVLPRLANCSISRLCSAGLETQAVRMPAHNIARDLLTACGLPLAAPSANLSGRVSPTTAAHVAAQIGETLTMILDGGPCGVGLESTVLDLSNPLARLLRPGAITQEMLMEVVGPLEVVSSDHVPPEGAALTSPGQMISHYAPTLPVRLNAGDVDQDEALLAFGPDVPIGAAQTVNLSPTGDLVEAAARLFDALHCLDRKPLRAIAVMPIPEEGLGRAINDRLRRAAAPRPPVQG
ncbi:L-threonylcarbamoyladenylate synthase [Limibacillus sp. MBR-115]|jgi:L-threonylcarbamoyladenylate synthase|uniref:L-threonylcarbamoyladenylate synthase n=1 Tax=Limibacillus sp. MBR-115 TaxID=3156465 RepID=UPI0033952D7C